MDGMELIRGLSNLRERHRGSVVTIGTYDGIHLGHQALIRRVTEHAQRLGREAVLLTFEPMPREYLVPADPPARLTSWRERWRLFGQLNLDAVWLLRFCESLRRLSGDEFASLLAESLGAPVVVVGHDFRFGRNGEASVPMLTAAGQRLGFSVDVVAPVTIDGERVSSSGVRAALARGDLEFARRWLGRRYSMRGRVVRGNQLGRTLGFPTANLRVERKRCALSGIFAVRVHGVEGPGPAPSSGASGSAEGRTGAARIVPGAAPANGLPGVASLGTRPTVNGQETLLEAHVFDFAGDLYGREIEVEFVAKLRDEERFPDLDALVQQMNRDAQQARSILAESDSASE
jgi:riboflavin kinase/FMN adenylyltransferase